MKQISYLEGARRIRRVRRLVSGLAGAALSGVLACGYVGIDLDGDGHEDIPPPRDGFGGSFSDVRPVDGRGGTVPDDAPPDAAPPDGTKVDASAPPSDAGDAGTSDAGHQGTDGGPGADAGNPGGDPRDAGTSPPDDTRDAAPPVDRVDAGSGSNDQCAPDCRCEADGDCSLICGGASLCEPSCSEGSSCEIDVGQAQLIDISCGEGATCSAGNGEADNAFFTCEGPGDCSASCGDAQVCSIECLGSGTCTLDCGNAESCQLACGLSSACVMLNAGDLPAFSCDDQQQRQCGPGLVTCGTVCPPS